MIIMGNYGYNHGYNHGYNNGYNDYNIDYNIPIFYGIPSRVNCAITTERSTMFHGKIHYFDWAMASIANC